MDEKKAICLTCMDGHIQLPVIHWIIGRHNVEYVDMITEPEIAHLLSDHESSIENIKRKINHALMPGDGSKLFIAGHANCDFPMAGHSEQKHHVRTATARMKNEFPNLDIYGLWFESDHAVEVLNEDLS